MACTGSSPNWTAQTWADVGACHSVASDGDTITVAAGNYTVTLQTTISKYVKIVMNGTVNLTDNVCSGPCGDALISLEESTVGNTKLQGPLYITKGSGYHEAPAGVVNLARVVGGKPLLVTDVHYTLTGSGNFFYASTNRGVIWDCTNTGSVAESSNCFNNASFLRHKPSGLGISDWESPPNYGMDDANGDENLYVEDCTIDKILEAVDVDDDGRLVFRYNTCINSGTLTHGVDTSGILGGRYIDYDHNTFVRDVTVQGAPCNAPVNMNGFIALRGGTALIHDNIIPDINDGAWGDKDEVWFALWELRRSAGGYPCWGTTTPGSYPAPHQPGWGWSSGGSSYALSGGGTGTQDLEPIYIWNNIGTGNYGAPGRSDYSPNECGAGAPTITDYVQVNREYYLNTAKPGYTAFTYPHPLAIRSERLALFLR